jgi:hypothetical protein
VNAKGAKDDIRDLAPDPAAPERLNEFLRRCGAEAADPDSLIARFKEADTTSSSGSGATSR